MKKQTSWVNDVEELVEDTTLAEASQKIWDKFDQAMNQLDEGSQRVLKTFFDGQSLEELSNSMQLSKGELEKLLSRARRQLVENLRQGFQVRQ